MMDDKGEAYGQGGILLIMFQCLLSNLYSNQTWKHPLEKPMVK